MNKQRKQKGGQVRFVTEYVHRWTKKVMRARDYGYKAWPFGHGKKKS